MAFISILGGISHSGDGRPAVRLCFPASPLPGRRFRRSDESRGKPSRRRAIERSGWLAGGCGTRRFLRPNRVIMGAVLGHNSSVRWSTEMLKVLSLLLSHRKLNFLPDPSSRSFRGSERSALVRSRDGCPGSWWLRRRPESSRFLQRRHIASWQSVRDEELPLRGRRSAAPLRLLLLVHH